MLCIELTCGTFRATQAWCCVLKCTVICSGPVLSILPICVALLSIILSWCIQGALGPGAVDCTVLWCVQRRSGLVLGQDLHAHCLTGSRQQLSGFSQRAKLH